MMWPRPFSLDGPRRNWRLYALMLPGGLLAAAAIFRMLGAAQTAGFSVATYKWHEYAFGPSAGGYLRLPAAGDRAGGAGAGPRFRALADDPGSRRGGLPPVVGGARGSRNSLEKSLPARLLRLPDFPDVPRADLDHCADRRRGGERRMYLALLGLILIACEGFGRMKLSRPAAIATIGAAVLVLGGLCQARNRWWSQPELLLAHLAAGARHNPRPLLNVAEALIRRGGCELALPYLDRAEPMLPRNYFVHSIRGRALAMGRLDEAVAHMQFAAQLRPGPRSSSGWAWSRTAGPLRRGRRESAEGDRTGARVGHGARRPGALARIDGEFRSGRARICRGRRARPERRERACAAGADPENAGQSRTSSLWRGRVTEVFASTRPRSSAERLREPVFCCHRAPRKSQTFAIRRHCVVAFIHVPQ